MNKATRLVFSGAPRSGSQRASRPLPGKDQTLFLEPSVWRVHLPFPRPGDNGGSPRGASRVLTQGRDPGDREGAGPRHLSPSLPKPCPGPDSTGPPLPLWGPVLPRHPQTGRQPHRWCSPPCRLSEVRPSRRRAMGKAQALMMPAEWEGTPCGPLNTPAGWGPGSPLGWQTPGGQPLPPAAAGDQPQPPPCPTPHPSRVLTAGTGSHLAPRGSSTPVRGWGPGVRPGGSAAPPPVGEGQVGTPGPAQTQLGVRGEPSPETWVWLAGDPLNELVCYRGKWPRNRVAHQDVVTIAQADVCVMSPLLLILEAAATTPGDAGPLPPAEPRLARVGLSLPSTRDGDTQGWLTHPQPSLCCFSKAQRGPIRCTRLHPPPPPPSSFISLSCSAPSALTLTLGTEWGPGGELLKLQWGAEVQAGCLAVDEPRAGAQGGGLVES